MIENDENKKMLYVPEQISNLGLMNNFDKNFVLICLMDWQRRFTIVSVLPPKEDMMDNEISNCKSFIANKLPKKTEEIGTLKLDDSYINTLFDDSSFKLMNQY